MKLSSLIRLHQQQQQQQLEEMRQRSETLRRLLSDDQELYGIIKEELKDLARKYGGPRRTLLLPPGAPYQQKPSPLSEEELALLNTEGEADEPKDDGRRYCALAGKSRRVCRDMYVYLFAANHIEKENEAQPWRVIDRIASRFTARASNGCMRER